MSKLCGAYYLEGWLCVVVVVCSPCCCFVLFVVAHSQLLVFFLVFSHKKKSYTTLRDNRDRNSLQSQILVLYLI